MNEIIRFGAGRASSRRAQNISGANGATVVRFVPKSERERARLIREARAIYDSIFPPADPGSAR